MFGAGLRQLFRRLKHAPPRRVQIGLNRRAGLCLSRYSRAIARAVHPPPTGPHSRHEGHHGPQTRDHSGTAAIMSRIIPPTRTGSPGPRIPGSHVMSHF
jgi:hypothetical protein